MYCIADNLPCLPLSVDIGMKKNVQPTCHQWATSGQPVGAKRVTQYSVSVPWRTTRHTNRVPKCSQPHYCRVLGWWWCATCATPLCIEDYLVLWIPDCLKLNPTSTQWSHCSTMFHRQCTNLYQFAPGIAGMVVLQVHNAPSYPLATDQLSPVCIFSPVCILATFFSNLTLHTCHQCWTMFAHNCTRYCAVFSFFFQP